MTGDENRRRVIYRERINGSLGWNTMHAVLADVNLDIVPATGEATGQPHISGTPEVGRAIMATLGTIADPDGIANLSFPADYTFQWTRNRVDIAGETGGAYVVQAADVGEGIRVEVSFTDDAGHAEGPLISQPVTGRASGVLPNASAPTVTIGAIGTVRENTTQALVATVAGGTYDHLSYAWQVVSGGGTITGAGSHVTYNPPDVTADTPVQVRVTVTAVGSGGNAQSGTSDTSTDTEDFTVAVVVVPVYYLGIRADTAFTAADFTVMRTGQGPMTIPGDPEWPDGERRYIAVAKPAVEGAFSRVYYYPAGRPNTRDQLRGWESTPNITLGGIEHVVIVTRGPYRDNARGQIIDAD